MAIWNEIKTFINSDPDAKPINETIGEIEEGSSLISKIEEIKSLQDDINTLVSVLTGDATVDGSVAQQIAAIVANAPEKFDTLKEIAAWIESDTDGAAKMQSDITSLGNTMGDKYSASKTYYVNEYCIYNNTMWKCKKQHSNQTPSEGTYWTKVTIAEELNLAKSSTPNVVTSSTTFNEDGTITETFDDGGSIKTTFNADGSITEKTTYNNGTSVSKKTTFGSDGNITQAIV